MVRPKFVVLENVAAILNNGLGIVLGELSEAGYDAEWAVISASSLGACHQRSRWWLVAYPNGNRIQGRIQRGLSREWEILSEESKRSEMGSKIGRCSQTSTNSNSQRTQIQYEQRGSSIWNLPSSYGKKGSTLSPNWQAYESEPCLRRGNDGLSNWTHRLKALGNSVVPQVAAIPLQRVLDLENERQA